MNDEIEILDGVAYPKGAWEMLDTVMRLMGHTPGEPYLKGGYMQHRLVCDTCLAANYVPSEYTVAGDAPVNGMTLRHCTRDKRK